MYRLLFTRQARRDEKRMKGSQLADKARELLLMITHNPYQSPPFFERLRGEYEGSLSRRINIQHRIVYKVYEKENIVKIIRMWTHYE